MHVQAHAVATCGGAVGYRASLRVGARGACVRDCAPRYPQLIHYLPTAKSWYTGSGWSSVSVSLDKIVYKLLARLLQVSMDRQRTHYCKSNVPLYSMPLCTGGKGVQYCSQYSIVNSHLANEPLCTIVGHCALGSYVPRYVDVDAGKITKGYY